MADPLLAMIGAMTLGIGAIIGVVALIVLSAQAGWAFGMFVWSRIKRAN